MAKYLVLTKSIALRQVGTYYVGKIWSRIYQNIETVSAQIRSYAET